MRVGGSSILRQTHLAQRQVSPAAADAHGKAGWISGLVD